MQPQRSSFFSVSVIYDYGDSPFAHHILFTVHARVVSGFVTSVMSSLTYLFSNFLYYIFYLSAEIITYMFT